MSDPICANCRFFRVKAERGDGDPAHEIGICTHFDVCNQVKIRGIPAVLQVLEQLGMPDVDACLLAAEIDVRVRGDFGCRHFEREADE